MRWTKPRRFGAGVAGLAMVLTGLVAPVAHGASECPECVNSEAPLTVQGSGGKTYNLVWNDEFNGDSLDEAWTPGKDPENGSMRYDNTIGERGEANISVADGFLRLQAFPMEEPEGKFNSTSGNISTVDSKAWKYGRFEARVKFPDSPGMWPAGWMMPDNSMYGWPRDGEIDWIEYPSSVWAGKQNQTVLHTASKGSERQLNDSAVTGFYTDTNNLGGEWFTWVMEWDETGFKFYKDDDLYKFIRSDAPVYEGGQSDSNDDVSWDSSWIWENGKTHERITDLEPFDQKFYMILNLGTRVKMPGVTAWKWAYGDWDAIQWDNAKFDVDYFRVYQTAEQQEQQNVVNLNFDDFAEGTMPDGFNPAQTRTVGQVAGDLPVPTADEGRIFDGWFTNTWIRGSDGKRMFSKKLSADTPINKDTVALAKWIDEFTISYDYNGKGGENTSVTAGDEKKITLPTPSDVTGYTFVGWFSDADLTNQVQSPYTVTGNATLYAKWTANPATLTFNVNGGEAVDDVSTTYDASVELPAPTKEGHTFAGWFSDEDLTEQVQSPYTVKGDATLYAKWTANPVVVTLDVNGGDAIEAIDSTYGAPVELPTPTREGYSFQGWFTDEGLETAVPEEFAPKADTTVYAKWTANPVVVTLDVNGGDAIEAINSTYGAPVELPTPTREGYSFEGWFTDEGLETAVPEEFAPKADTTVYAKWEILPVTVTLDVNGGDAIEAIDSTYGAPVDLPTPTREGYSFQGWFTDEDLETAVPEEFAPKADTTVYAKWSANPATLTFNVNGGEAVDDVSTTYDASVELPTPTKEGHTFAGWFSDEDLTNQVESPYTVKGDATLYAKWTANPVVVTLDVNGGDAIEAIDSTYGAPVDLPTPTREGYSFQGWFTDEDLETAVPGEFAPTADTTVYAKWSANPATLTFNVNGGSAVEDVSTTYDASVELPTPTKEGHTFAGWFSDEDLTNQVESPYTVKGDATLYAKWTANPVVVTLDVNGGDAIEAIDSTYGAAVELPTPTREGYSFQGWFTDEDLETAVPEEFAPKADTTVYAKWVKDAPTGMVYRAEGLNRYVTALQVASQFENPSGTIYVATGQTYPDALTAAAVAGQKNAPVVLVETNNVPEQVAVMLEKYGPNKIVIVGGPGAVTDRVKDQLGKVAPKADFSYIDGKNRFDTAAQLAKSEFKGSVNTVYLASGLDFPDALSASAAAAYENGPVLLVMKDKLPAETADALKALKANNVVVVGGTGVVSNSVASQAAAITGAELSRYGGANRFATSQQVAESVFGGTDLEYAVVADGMKFPDALVGAAFAGSKQGPVLLTQTTVLNDETRAALMKLDPSNVLVTGGPAAVSDAVIDQIAKVTK